MLIRLLRRKAIGLYAAEVGACNTLTWGRNIQLLYVKYSKTHNNNEVTIIEHCVEMFKDELSVVKKGELHLESQNISQFIFVNGVAKASFCFT